MPFFWDRIAKAHRLKIASQSLGSPITDLIALEKVDVYPSLTHDSLTSEIYA
jgi:hypothetical protein